MKKRRLFLIGILIWNFNSVFGQSCGTPHPINPTIYPQEDTNLQAKGSSSSICINVFFHIVRNSNGTNAFNLPNTTEIINNLNQFYSTHNVIINNLGTDFIDNSSYLNVDNENESANLGQINNRSDAINYYIVSELWNVYDNNGNIIGFVAGTANNIPSNNLVIRNDRTLTTTSPHEIGHCLNLLHTHETARGLEAINGSNCGTTGDLVCDTPADPRLGTNNVNANCEYFGGNGYNPLTNNIMSYSRNHCRDEFTNGQGFRIRSAIQNEPILQNVVSNSCTTISEVNNVCYPETKTISLTNLGNAITFWTSSNNIHIVSNNNTSAEIRALNSNSIGDGWIRATLNNGIILQENFEVGIPNIDLFNITNASLYGNTYKLNNRVWNKMDISKNSVLWYGLPWEVSATNSLIRHSYNSPKFDINPNQNYGNIQIGIRTENECGCSNWKWKTFSVEGATGGGVGGILNPE